MIMALSPCCYRHFCHYRNTRTKKLVSSSLLGAPRHETADRRAEPHHVDQCGSRQLDDLIEPLRDVSQEAAHAVDPRLHFARGVAILLHLGHALAQYVQRRL